MKDPNDRLRQHPEQRFGPPQLQLNVDGAAQKLAKEPLAANRKHRQQTLYRHGPLTIALFLFEAGGSLAPHTADGIVTVHVLQGRLKMVAEHQVHDLPRGEMLVLAPGVQHDLEAIEPTRMLLTVCLEQQTKS